MIAKEISSLQHPIVKHLVKLRTTSSYRKEQNSVLVAGENTLRELAQTFPFQRLLMQKGFSPPFIFTAKEIIEVPEGILKKTSGLVEPGPWLAELALPPMANLSSCHRLLILDGIADPGNLGTLLRTALGLGWDGAFLLENSADPFNDKALRASKGAPFFLPMASGGIEELQALMKQKHWQIYGADMHGTHAQKISYSQEPLMLILGHEAHGLSPFTRQSSQLISIPMPGPMESLNVAVAGGILMFMMNTDSRKHPLRQ